MIREVFFKIIGGIMKRDFTLYSKENTNAQNTSTTRQNINDDSDHVTLQIKEEQLHIAKNLVQTGEVKAYIETFNEEKTFNIPVMRKELVVEKKILTSTTPECKEAPQETIRIPISEERVEFTKYNVSLEDISIYKQQIKDIKHIEETLKKEKAKVTISGSPRVKDVLNPNADDV
jgi:uncharacterized protein (TIGR02271 family)